MKKTFLPCTLFLALAILASGATVYDTSASLTGTRSIGNGLTDDSGGGYDGLLLSWNIVQLSDGTFTYTYAFDGFTAPDIANIILDLSDTCVVNGAKSSSCISNVQINGSAPKLDFEDFCVGCQGSLDGLAGDIIGVEFTNFAHGIPVTITFDSPNVPVWGDLFLKGGSDFVRNIGNADHTDSLTLDFVARPDTTGGTVQASVPEPATLGLTGGALVLLGLLRRRKKSVGSRQ